MSTKDKILDKIKALLNLSEVSKNNSDKEAEAAMLKAQELMAKYDVSIEEVTEQEQEQYSHEICEHKWDYGYRIPLAVVLSKNFRCETYLHGKSIVFMGHPLDAKICRETFEFAYKFIMKRGNQVYNQRYTMGLKTKGVFNSYATGFITGLKESFDVQCRALAIITPPDVVEEFKRQTEGWSEKKHSNIGKDARDYSAYREGIADGQKFMDRDKLPK